MKTDHRSTPSSRVGRPRREAAGDVDDRILAAAMDLFLQKGFAATSCEAVVARAGVGKASLYSRYSGKEPLFAAVVRQAMDDFAFRPDAADLSGNDVRARLAAAGRALLVHALSPIPLAMMRLFLTEARHDPDLIAQMDRMAWARAVDTLVRAMADTADDAGPTDAVEIAEQFLDLTFAPVMLAALLGRDAEPSMATLDTRIGFALDVLERSGLLKVANTQRSGCVQ